MELAAILTLLDMVLAVNDLDELASLTLD